jgi:hypothetical protein
MDQVLTYLKSIILCITSMWSINNPIWSKGPIQFVCEHKKLNTCKNRKFVAVPQLVRERIFVMGVCEIVQS